MKIDEAEQAIKKILPEKRFVHSVSVSETAGRLAKKYGGNEEKARLAGMLHDIAKYFSNDELKAMILSKPGTWHDCLDYSDKLWHAPAGAIYVQEKYGIDDSDLLQAMIYHTTGRKQMTLLDKIIFLADYIEPGRDFPGVEEVRKAAEMDLDTAVLLELQKTIMHLLNQQQRVYPKTFEAYNELVNRHANK
ncbi:bis(5'-nucleosyl)-tetraphosphatase (symmetrical) YqeK [Sporolactobacillus sp. CPB3-1]|uniref:bis(5'-nucleosyl)-tetraphosphatase (symmetrical) n=1 Tax=Sporolactobacillus mangiferae TaxID=2940498 RepID=A0ABT0M6F1_9BACL|nr:bis(5'-nucleosyl)-tetraphosphatase (symmetrical) YqeK [Sporolactobacillus mangiferae]MCL1630440.1 bis(5'-nucleosyl)-tetraphosphatase (symmetrical) YqeK [Sporolactobacillus mangiferae]